MVRPTQLEKIDMLDLADFIVVNKSDRRGAEDALRDVRKQWKPQPQGASHCAKDEEIPVFRDDRPSQWNDAGVDRGSLRGRCAKTCRRGGRTAAFQALKSIHLAAERR